MMSHRLCLKSLWTAYIDNIKAGFYILMTVCLSCLQVLVVLWTCVPHLGAGVKSWAANSGQFNANAQNALDLLFMIKCKQHIDILRYSVKFCWFSCHFNSFLSCFSGKDKSEEVKIVAVDLQAMAPLPGVTQIQGDITKVQ